MRRRFSPDHCKASRTLTRYCPVDLADLIAPVRLADIDCGLSLYRFCSSERQADDEGKCHDQAAHQKRRVAVFNWRPSMIARQEESANRWPAHPTKTSS